MFAKSKGKPQRSGRKGKRAGHRVGGKKGEEKCKKDRREGEENLQWPGQQKIGIALGRHLAVSSVHYRNGDIDGHLESKILESPRTP